MKDTCKSWLQVITACLGLSATTWGQSNELASPGDQAPQSEIRAVADDDYGTVKLSGREHSASASVAPSGIQPTGLAQPAPPMFREAMVPHDDDIGFVSTALQDRILWRVGHSSADRYGITGGFSNLNAFIPVMFENDRSLWWVNPRVMITDYGEAAGSAGLGYRTYNPTDDRVYGASFWYDYDNGHVGTYQTLGGSFESIGRYFSMRFNFDLPFGDTENVVDLGPVGTPRFSGSTVVVDRMVTTEKAYQEFDFELATPIPYLGDYGFEVGVGAYYLTAEGADGSAGVSLRTQAQIGRDFWLRTTLTNDDIYDTNFSISCELTLPQGGPCEWFTKRPVSDSLTASVIRRYRVPTAESFTTQTTIANNNSGVPIQIAVIDPNVLTPGDGSFENPFMSVFDYESQTDAIKSAFDVVFVRARTDDTDTNLNTTIDLFDGQALIGDGDTLNGTSQFFVSSNLGRVVIPGLMPGPAPMLSNSGALGEDVVTLANSNVVTNFNIDATGTADAIAGVGIDGFELRNLNISNAVHGINIESDTTPVTNLAGEGFGFIGNNVINGGGIGANQGVLITHTDGTLDLLISENTITDFLGEDGNDNGVIDPTEDVDMDGILDTGAGIRVIADGATAILRVDDFLAENGDNPTGLFNNNISANSSGIELTADNGSTFDVALIGNDSSGNLSEEGAGLVVLGDDTGVFTITAMRQNQFDNNAGDGALFIARDNGTVLAAKPEDINGNGVLDPSEDLNGNGVLDPGEDTNGNGLLDLAEDLNMNGVLDTGIFGNSFSGNGSDGVELLADNAILDVNIGAFDVDSGTRLSNTISGNGTVTTIANTVVCEGNGVLLTTLNGGTVMGSINGNAVTNNVESGIQIASDMGAVNLDSISGNVITGNGVFNGNPIPLECNAGDAIVFAPSNGGTFSVGEFTGNTIANNQGAIIRVGGNGGIVDLGIIEDTVFDLTTAGTAGILFDADNATITGTLRNNEFRGSLTNPNQTFGVGGTIRGGTLDLTIEENLFTDLADAGIGFVFTESDTRIMPGTPSMGDAAEASLVISNNTIQNTQAGNNPNFDGAGISLQVQGRESDILFGQNDIDNDGIIDATTIPLPDGSDITTLVNPAAILEAVIEGNLIGSLSDPALGNSGPGIDIRVSGDGAITDLAAFGSTIDNPELNGISIGRLDGTAFQGNIIANNDLDGIRVRRRDSGIIDNFNIDGNIIQNNLEDGIDIQAQNNGIPFGVEEILDFDIVENQILNNGFQSDGTQGAAGRGITVRADAGAVVEVNVGDLLDMNSGNLIGGNRMSGIEYRTFTDSHSASNAPGRSFTITAIGPRDAIESASGGDEGVIYGEIAFNTIIGNGFLSNEDTNGNGLLDPSEDTNGNGVLDVSREGHGIALGRIDFVDPDNPAQILEGYNNGGLLLPDGAAETFTEDANGNGLLDVGEDTNGNGLLDRALPLFDGQSDLPITTIYKNLIEGNAEDGIHLYLDKDSTPIFGDIFTVAGEEVRQTRVEIISNDIRSNGDDGLDIHNALSAQLTMQFTDNLVDSNGLYSGVDTVNQAGGNTVNVIGDGIQITTANYATTLFTAERNRIVDNFGRGVNILTMGNQVDPAIAYAVLNFDRNSILSNGREGFYLINAPLENEILSNSTVAAGTAQSGYTTFTWLADFDSNHELFNWGFLQPGAGNTPPAVFAPFLDSSQAPPDAPVTDLLFTSNIVNNNGGVVPDSDGEAPYSTLGGMVLRVGTATSDFSAPFPIPSIPAPRAVGGLRAEIENNLFSGNFGRDYYMDGFVATVPPTVDVLPDPLVRIDLQFRNNRGGSIDVGGLNFNVFYTNTAPNVFGGPNVKRPVGPFANAAVPRDAVRNLGLFAGLPFPSIIGGGVPTIRIESDGAAQDAFGNFLGNNEFNVIYSDFDPTIIVGAWLIVPTNSLVDPPVVLFP